MMRSLYSGVSGLKTHQTKMDVLGNNISNVNTVAFKSSTVTFNEIMYQTTQGASGANALTGTGGINAKQIGLGVALASTTTNISTPGATQTTGSALDVKINGDSFFIVSDGTTNLFTRAGSFYFDGAGNLAMTSTGYNVMGWQVDPSTGEIKKDTVSPLRIMQAANLTSAPEATTNAIVAGVLDSNSSQVKTDDGYVMNLNFFDSLGYSYTAKFKVTKSDTDGIYNVALTDVLDSNAKSVLTDTIRPKDLFGTAYTGQKDSGTLKAGRTINSETIITGSIDTATGLTFGGTTITLKDGYTLNQSTVGANTVYTITDDATNTVQATFAVDAAGNIVDDMDNNGVADVDFDALVASLQAVTDGSTGLTIGAGDAFLTAPVDVDNTMRIVHHWLTDTEGQIIDNSDIYVSADDGKYYYHDAINDVYIPLSNTQEQYRTAINQEAAKIQQFFSDHFSGIDPDIIISGNSTYSDITNYITNLSFGDTTLKLNAGYSLSVTDDGTRYTYTIKDITGNDYASYTVDMVSGVLVSADANCDGVTEGDFALLTERIKSVTEGAADSWVIQDDAVFGTFTEMEYGYQIGITGTKYFEELRFNTSDGTFTSIGNADAVTLAMATLGGMFEDISIDFTQSTMFNNGGTSTLAMDKGGLDGSTGAGKKLGALTGVSIDTNGMIYGSYDNGNTVLLGQIAVANFANASGLEKVGDNCYQTTLNSGEFDGIGVDITADGGSMTTGALEMSNVDLSTEFTELITTQRGFQANSRVITTSDTLLEELINLKR